MAAVLGQVRRWENSLRTPISTKSAIKPAPKPVAAKAFERRRRAGSDGQVPPDGQLGRHKKLAGKNNDRVEDEIESVKGLVAIDDLDNADAETVAAQYAAMTDLVVIRRTEFQNRIRRPDIFCFRQRFAAARTARS
jgi:hypothetical protein